MSWYVPPMTAAFIPAPFNTPPAWTNGHLTLFHGTTLSHALAIQAGGVNPAFGRTGTDFGPGFYTTTLLRQAKSWAWALAAASGMAGAVGAVVELDVDRDQLARLDTLAFVRGDYDADEFWSFVFHCRNGATNHARGSLASTYDVVYGPVTDFWMQRGVIQGADQVSFHTVAAARLLTVKQVFSI
jgi:Protein of unknown function (DUF3990)